jgi:hypothetical protein
VFDGGGLVVDFRVGLRRGDGEREGKIWGENGLGKKMGIKWTENLRWVFKFFYFFLIKKEKYVPRGSRAGLQPDS